MTSSLLDRLWSRRPRFPPADGRLRLAPVDEHIALPAYGSVRKLMRGGARRGWTEALPAIDQRASEWMPGCIGEKGGSFIPSNWEDDPCVPFRGVDLYRLADALYFPAFGVVVSTGGEVMLRSMEEAKYITKDLTALPGTERSSEHTSLTGLTADVMTLDRAVVTMPWGAVGNYGHFVLDCLPGAALVRSYAELDGHPLVFPPLQDWQRRHLQLLGVDPVELPGAVYRVRDLVFVSCMAHFLHHPNVNTLTVRETQLPRRAVKRTPARLYISRGDRPYRRFLSEEPLREALQSRGFAVVAPELQAIEEQIATFHGAAIVVGSMGAALANALYCQRGATVVEIKSPFTMGLWVAWLCALVGCEWRPYYCGEVVAGEPKLVGGKSRLETNFAFDADLSDLLRFIDRLLDPDRRRLV